MVGITFAKSEGAASFVEQYANDRFDGVEEGKPVRMGEVLVTVTGPGKIKATLNTERLLRQYDLEVLFHGGGAISLSDDLDVNTLIGVTSVLEGDRVNLESPSYPRMPLEFPFDLAHEGALVTQDHSTGSSEERSYWERIAEVRDTTGYAVAYVAAQHGVSCHIVKGIAAQADAEAPTAEEPDVLTTVASFLRRQVDAITDEDPA